MDTLLQAARMAGEMAWNTFWALVLGFTVSGAVQAFVSERKMSKTLGGEGWKEIGLATLFGAASSSCSFGAVATAKSLFKKGASAVAALAAFQFASTNLVIELGLVMAILLGWQFVTAEFVAGLILILMLSAVFKWVVPASWLDQAREHVRGSEGLRDPVCGMEVDKESAVTLEENGQTVYFCSKSCRNAYQEQQEMSIRERLTTRQGWLEAFRNALKDWNMLWKDILIGFVIAGLIGAFVPRSWWAGLFSVGGDSGLWHVVASALIGTFIGVATFVCSVGNVPFAVILWQNGIPFGGVAAFLFADLIIPNIVNAYRRYYGLRMAAVMFVSIFVCATVAGVIIHYLWMGLNLIPDRGQGSSTAPHGYTLYLNIVAAVALGLQVYFTNMRKSK